jgi:hypothetical protein
MSGRIAVVICNWNKKDYVIQCVESVLRSDTEDVDIYVVDNASTDGSVPALRERFGNRITVLGNPENRGGAGGFNEGIRYAFQKGYPYIHLLDNDVVLDRDAIGRLRVVLEEDPRLGIAGSLIYDMDRPQIVQELGSQVNWETFKMDWNYHGHHDTGNLPDEKECDCVPACSLMIRREVLDRIGGMDEQYFIYWDDIDLCYRTKLAGYRVAAFSGSKVWHKRGAINHVDTFSNYYYWRNRLYFFAKYCPDEKLHQFIDYFFEEYFRGIFFPYYKGQPSVAKSVVIAVEDALQNIRGRARPQRILQKEKAESSIDSIIREAGTAIAIIDSPALNVMRQLIERIRNIRSDVHIQLVAEYHSPDDLQLHFPNEEIVPAPLKVNESTTVFKTCMHVLDERNRLSNHIALYVDNHSNAIGGEQDRKTIQQYDEVYRLYKTVHLPVLRVKIEELRQTLQEDGTCLTL